MSRNYGAVHAARDRAAAMADDTSLPATVRAAYNQVAETYRRDLENIEIRREARTITNAHERAVREAAK